ncbi:MAG: hypothetical protein IPL52_09065 [Flavobacteriales bacterium]|nr:hypothetical protein [Flavobacteriales bacterium]
MRLLLLCLLLFPLAAPAQDAKRFQRALNSGNERTLDRWMKHEIHRVRKGQLVTASSGSYTVHHSMHDNLVDFLRRQPGVEDAAWDKCVNKILLWPGHSTIGMRWRAGDVLRERCWTVQEGRPGTIKIFGWHARLRKSREQLKYTSARRCEGFVEEQKRLCVKRAP